MKRSSKEYFFSEVAGKIKWQGENPLDLLKEASCLENKNEGESLINEINLAFSRWLAFLDFQEKILNIIMDVPTTKKEFDNSLSGAMKCTMDYVGAESFEVFILDYKNRSLKSYLTSTGKIQEDICFEGRDKEVNNAFNAFFLPIKSFEDLINPQNKDTKPRFGRERDGTFTVMFPCYDAKHVFDSIVQFKFKPENLGRDDSERSFNREEIESNCCFLEELFAKAIHNFRFNAAKIREIKREGLRDKLTGIGNRKLFDALLSKKLEEVKRKESSFALLLLDIDHFKGVNDQYGHLAGDFVLQKVAQALEDRLRGSDVIARYGGEEFAVILSGTDSLSKAQKIAETLRKLVESLNFQYRDNDIHVTVSVGVSLCSKDDDNPDGIITRADNALYRAKDAGRNQVVLDGQKNGAANSLPEWVEKIFATLKQFSQSKA